MSEYRGYRTRALQKLRSWTGRVLINVMFYTDVRTVRETAVGDFINISFPNTLWRGFLTCYSIIVSLFCKVDAGFRYNYAGDWHFSNFFRERWKTTGLSENVRRMRNRDSRENIQYNIIIYTLHTYTPKCVLYIKYSRIWQAVE